MGVSVRKILLFLFAILFAIVGLIGVVFFLAYSFQRGPVKLRNNFIGAWQSLILFFYSVELVYVLFKKENRLLGVPFFVDIVYYFLIVIGTLFTAVCYGLVYRWDSVALGGVTSIISLISLIVLIKRRIEAYGDDNTGRKAQYIATTEQDAAPSTADLLDKNKKDSKKDNACKSTARFINALLKLLFIVIVALVAAGSFITGGLTLKFPARGQVVQVPLDDASGRTIGVHYLCDGPKNSTLPTIVFEGSISHGYADYLGLQLLLKQQNVRSCIWDKPGLGYSDFLFSDMPEKLLESYYHNFIQILAKSEKAPFIFAGWGGGGELSYRYASKHPENVHSITFIDTSPPGIEWTTPFILRNLSREELTNLITQDMTGRYRSVYVINALGIPLGLIKLFYPPGEFFPPELAEEKDWYYLTEKSWITQRHFLDSLPAYQDTFRLVKIDDRIQLNHIMTVKSDEQTVKQRCQPQNLDINSPECQYFIRENQYSISERRRLVKLTQAGGTIKECTDDKCNLGYFIYDGPQFTVKALLELYQK